jgi:DNA-binding response OmpR family regulator
MTSTSAVLLAEHEPASRELLERHLRDDGFTVFGAAWTARALDLAERVSPDVVIAGETDLCRRLRAGEPGRSWDRNVPLRRCQ